MTRISRAEALTLGGILILAVLARYTGLAQGFPRDFHWDERIYFHEALYGLANGLRRESTVSANLPYLLMPVLLLQWLYGGLTGALHSFAGLTRAYIADPAPSLLLARAVWAASGVAGVAMAWRVGRRVSGPVAGLLGAFFLAGAFLHVEQSHFIKNDVPAALLLLCATDALFNIAERGGRRDYFWAGFWIGLAAATKYYCAAVAPLILLAHWLHGRSARRAPDAAAPAPGPARLAISAAAGLLGVLLTTPIAVIDPANLRDSLAWELGARFGSIPTGDMPQPLFYLTQHLGPGMGEPLLALGLAGGVVALTRLTPKSLLLVAVPVVFFIAINLRPNNFARYAVPAVPFLCVTAAIALRTLVGAVLSPTLARLRGLALSHDTPALRALASGPMLRRLGPTLLTLGAILASAPSWLNVIRYDRFAGAPDTRNAAQTWFETAVPPGAAVLIEGGESFERTSNLGPQLWPTAAQLEARGPNEPRERFFWTQLLDVVRTRPAYALQLVGAVERTSAEVNGQRVATAVRSMSEWGSPDYAVLINWRSDDLRPGSANPLWQNLNTAYELVATFACRPCFPEDYYAWRIDYPTLAQVPVLDGAPVGGPEVRVFQRKTTRFPARAPAAPSP